MKKLYLIGDSIRMHYDRYVAAALKDSVKVYYPDENCRFSAYVFYSLGDWEHRLRVGADCDVIHWNCGLHDVVRYAENEPMTPPEIYAYYLERACKDLDRLYPNAKKVFATSTPVQEDKYDYWLSRKNADIEHINEIAKEIVTKYGHEVNDLWTVMKNAPVEYFSDKTHFGTPEGTRLLTETVIEKVCPLLGVAPDLSHFTFTEEDRLDEILR